MAIRRTHINGRLRFFDQNGRQVQTIGRARHNMSVANLTNMRNAVNLVRRPQNPVPRVAITHYDELTPEA
jgi:hypothetical protein